MKYRFFILISICFFLSCSRQKTNTNNLREILTLFGISENDSIILQQHNIIDEKYIPYDTLQHEILLLKFNTHQKSLIAKLSPLNQTNAFGAYLFEIQQRVPNIFTVIIYTDSDNGTIMYFINYKDTSLIDYIYNEGNIGYVTEQTNDKEIIEGYKRWVEFHNDTIFKIKIKMIKYDYYLDNKQDVEYKTDSVITKFKIEGNGKFKKLSYDSIAFVR